MLLEQFLILTDSQKQIILHIYNATGFIISIFTLYCIYCNISSTILPFIFFQCLIELLICPTIDAILHHILVVSIISLFIFDILNINTLHHEIKIIVSVEISTIFLVLTTYLPKIPLTSPFLTLPSPSFISKIIKFNQLCFVTSFFYTRIYLYSKYIIYGILLKEVTTFPKIVYILLYLFYLLNLYWFTIIIKKLFKMVITPLPPSTPSAPIITLIYLPFMLYLFIQTCIQPLSITYMISLIYLICYVFFILKLETPNLIGLLYLLDFYIVFCISPNKINVSIITYIIGLILYIKPFYQWNNILFVFVYIVRHVLFQHQWVFTPFLIRS
jgi:hypothetical protein